jgi:hypothetical protein
MKHTSRIRSLLLCAITVNSCNIHCREMLEIKVNTSPKGIKTILQSSRSSLDLVVDSVLSWRYGSSHGKIILIQEASQDRSSGCIIYNDSVRDVDLIISSDPHQSCKFSHKSAVIAINESLGIRIPVEIDSAGDDKNYLPGVINLLFDKKKKSLCSPDADQASPWACRKGVYTQFYKQAK